MGTQVASTGGTFEDYKKKLIEAGIAQNLTEEQLREFKHKIDWNFVSSLWLSEEFFREFQDKINFKQIRFDNEKISNIVTWI